MAHSRAACRSSKYVSNRFLTLIQKLLIGHEIIRIPHRVSRMGAVRCSNGFHYCVVLRRLLFDNQIIVQNGLFRISHRRNLLPYQVFRRLASSINFKRSVVYGIGVLKTALQFLFEPLEADESAISRRQGSVPSAAAPAFPETYLPLLIEVF